jgi:hypothetical protein
LNIHGLANERFQKLFCFDTYNVRLRQIRHKKNLGNSKVTYNFT